MYVGVILIKMRDHTEQIRIPHVCGGDPAK